MKLYTEEQIRATWNAAFMEGMSIDSEIYEAIFFEDHLNSLTPIELPSDEEINEVAMVVYGFNAKDVKDVLEYKAFKRGAKYVINKIQGGNK